MPSIRILKFAGLLPEVSDRLLREDHAVVAHNTLLWNGQLRSMPAWTQQAASLSGSILSILSSPGSTFQYSVDTQFKDAQVNYQEPFNPNLRYGIIGNVLKTKTTNNGALYDILPIPVLTSITQNITPQNQSVYPIPRTYAVTVKSGNMESAPYVLPQLGADGTLFEGDVVTLQFFFTNTGTCNPTGWCLYRTIPGFDTSEQLGNPRETAFHLVHEQFDFPILSGVTYVDSQPASAILGDRMMTEQFGPPLLPYVSQLGQSQSGWLIAAGYAPNSGSNKSQVQVSERFLWHAWPLQNYVEIPDQVVDMAVFYDEVFFGTPQRSYHMRVSFSDNVEIDSLDLTVRPMPDIYGCVPNTMVTTNFGAMYASRDGLIALEVNEDQVGTKKVTNPGDALLNPVADITIASAQGAAWWNGFYVGFCSGIGYLFNMENNHNNQFPLGQLVTFDSPSGIYGASLVIGSPGIVAFGGENPGLMASWGNVMYRWPLPGYGYDEATKLTYTWKSKVFVMPGGTTFAGAKLVHDLDGLVHVNFYGDGNLIYSINVQDSQPFRIPHNHNCVNWQVEIIGTATVKEFHLATSFRELTEQEGQE